MFVKRTRFVARTDPSLTGLVLEPNSSVGKHRGWLYELKQLQNGRLYVRVAVPGVLKDRFTYGKVMVTSEAPAVSHNSGGRLYSGDVALLVSPLDKNDYQELSY